MPYIIKLSEMIAMYMRKPFLVFVPLMFGIGGVFAQKDDLEKIKTNNSIKMAKYEYRYAKKAKVERTPEEVNDVTKWNRERHIKKEQKTNRTWPGGLNSSKKVPKSKGVKKFNYYQRKSSFN